MTTCNIVIHFPFRTSSVEKIVIRVTHTVKVGKLLNECFSLQFPNPVEGQDASKYGLIIRPQNTWLFEDCLLSEYSDSLSNTNTHTVCRNQAMTSIRQKTATVEFRPRYVRILVFLFANHQIIVPADPFETLGIALSRATSALASKHPSTENGPFWSLYSKDIKLNFETQISKVPHEYIIMHREFPPQQDAHIFGGSLSEALAKYPSPNEVPSFLTTLFRLIETHSSTVGIYRISGLKTNIETIQSKIEQKAPDLETYLSTQPVHDLTGTVKAYLRSLRESVFPLYFSNDMKIGLSDRNSEEKKIQFISRYLSSLPSSHISFLRAFCQHIEKITQNEKANQMSLANHAIIMGPTLMKMEKTTSPSQVAEDTKIQQTLARLLLENWKIIFGPNGSGMETEFGDPLFSDWNELDLAGVDYGFHQLAPIDSPNNVTSPGILNGLQEQNYRLDKKIAEIKDLLKKLEANPDDEDLRKLLAKRVEQAQIC